jgi:hypothetical protein
VAGKRPSGWPDDPHYVVVRPGAVVHLPSGAWDEGTMLVLERDDAISLIQQGVVDLVAPKDG